jgi:hypothetical protein
MFVKRLYPHLHEMYRLSEGDYNTSIRAQRYHLKNETKLEWEIRQYEKVEICRTEKLGGNDGIHKIIENEKRGKYFY